MKINKLKTEIQRTEQTGHELHIHEIKANFFLPWSNNPLVVSNASYSQTLHAAKVLL
jgi:hypothetical protein